MRASLIFIAMVGLAILSCRTKNNFSQEEEIPGIYIREYSFTVIHPQTGEEIGIRTVRDTIFIRSNRGGYEVSNEKWSRNDYDDKSWRNMEHADDRPMPCHQARFDPVNNAIVSEFYPPLYLKVEGGRRLCPSGKQKNCFHSAKE